MQVKQWREPLTQPCLSLNCSMSLFLQAARPYALERGFATVVMGWCSRNFPRVSPVARYVWKKSFLGQRFCEWSNGQDFSIITEGKHWCHAARAKWISTWEQQATSVGGKQSSPSPPTSPDRPSQTMRLEWCSKNNGYNRPAQGHQPPECSCPKNRVDLKMGFAHLFTGVFGGSWRDWHSQDPERANEFSLAKVRMDTVVNLVLFLPGAKNCSLRVELIGF